MRYGLVLISIALSIVGCQKRTAVLLPVSVADDNVKLQVPKAWKIRKKLTVFGPDCSSCSGGEYNEYFGDAFPGENHVTVQVEIHPAGRQRPNSGLPYSFKRQYAKFLSKNPNGITLLDTAYNQQESCTAITYLNSSQSLYLKSLEFSGRYRIVTFWFKVANTEESREQVEAMQRTIYVNPDFLNTVKL